MLLYVGFQLNQIVKEYQLFPKSVWHAACIHYFMLFDYAYECIYYANWFIADIKHCQPMFILNFTKILIYIYDTLFSILKI